MRSPHWPAFAPARPSSAELGLFFARVDQRAISKIERGAVADPMNSTVVLLETALGVQRGTLVFGSEAVAS